MEKSINISFLRNFVVIGFRILANKHAKISFGRRNITNLKSGSKLVLYPSNLGWIGGHDATIIHIKGHVDVMRAMKKETSIVQRDFKTYLQEKCDYDEILNAGSLSEAIQMLSEYGSSSSIAITRSCKQLNK